MLAAIAFLVVGLVLLVYSADFLVKGASNLAAAVGISPLVVGLTVVAFGTSAPELAVSVMAAFNGQDDIAVGNVVGSNIFNVLFILGISALIIPLVVHAQLVRFDVPVMIAVSVLLYLLSMDGLISRVDGLVLFALLVAYVVFLLRLSKKEKDAGVLSEYEQEYGKPAAGPKWIKNLAFVIGGVAGLVLGSDRLVYGAVFIAKHFGVSELIIGLTIISAGTSLPEVATSVVAALKGERDIAVGNVVGSNIFNILTVLGISSIITPLRVAEAALNFDILFMIAIAVAALPVFFHGYKIGRMSGFLFLAFYVAYIVYLILGAQGHAAFGGYRHVMLLYVAPATGLLLGGLLVSAIRNRKNLA
ncbi:calcium/sodium antiporter [Akkermansiaceae bacterium]|nr:calcium/sodium antiporter [Akkermansiaceae bacterium]